MNSFFSDHLNNTSLLEYINFTWGTFCGFFLNTVLLIGDEETAKVAFLETLWNLKVYFIIIALNFILIFIAWRIYNKRIEDQFMKPATVKAIEELKASVSKLRLPKEHTPRI